MPNEAQPVQWRALRGVDAVFAKKPVHEQHAPAIGQGVCDQAGQALQVHGESAKGCPLQGQMKRGQLNPLR